MCCGNIETGKFGLGVSIKFIAEVAHKLSVEVQTAVDWVEMGRGMVGNEENSKARDLQEYIWEMMNNCIWLEYVVKAWVAILRWDFFHDDVV